MKNGSDVGPRLLDAALAPVVPQEPLLAVVDGIGFVDRVVVPLVLARTDDRVGRMTFPVGDAVLRPCDADLRMAPPLKSCRIPN